MREQDQERSSQQSSEDRAEQLRTDSTRTVPGSSGDHFCTACGHRLRDVDQFCTSCGTPLLPPVTRRPLFTDEVPPATTPVETPREDPEASRPARFPLALIVAGLTLIAAALGIGLWLGGRTADTPVADGSAGEPSGAASTNESPSASASEDPSTSKKATPRPPQGQLRRASVKDHAAVSKLVGSWVPQLAAVAPGAGPDSSWSDALAHYEQLRSEYPGALLVDTAEWPHTYERGGLYAIVIPTAASSPDAALSWCESNRWSKNEDCAAKMIDTSGDWSDNYVAR